VSEPAHPVIVIAHLSGRFRGKIHRLLGDRLGIGIDSRAEIRFAADDLTPGLSKLPKSGPYATLERRGDTYELVAPLDADIWVNGRRVEQHVLGSGDVIEIGEGGPVLRFRIYPPGSRAYKSVAEVFSDCAQCARYSRNPVDRAGILIAGPPKELLTRTSPWVRIAVAVVLVVLVGAVAWLWTRSERLETRLLVEVENLRGLAAVLSRGDPEALSDEEIAAIRDALSDSVARIEELERRSGARGRVIAASARSVVFVQGAWGFEDSEGRPLRFVAIGPDGNPVMGPSGPRVTLEGDGPPVEILYTGTAFVVGSEGLLLTNRHVAAPWEWDDKIEPLIAQGLRPVIRRFIGYLPGISRPFELELVRASERLDVALLGYDGTRSPDVTPLPLAERLARPGDEVIVLGYPTGIAALVARADPEAVEAIRSEGPLDFWEVVERLSEGGWITPLATVGIVGQVTASSVVYDAETTHGGSGGPVLNLDGEVLAVNAAVLAEFGGSNLGVPAAEALRLLRFPEPPPEE
jgi:S1-C subfamily serine protease